MNKAGLYIHVPFCHSKCAYCDFYSLPAIDKFGERYVKALETEWNLRRDEVQVFSTIYFGGGTPSLLSAEAVEKIARWLPDIGVKGEFTVEFNPEDVVTGKSGISTAELWKNIGANRVSIGVQSFNDEELRAVGRRHNSRQAIDAYDMLADTFGSDAVSVDLILGLPGQTMETLQESLSTAISLKPGHISIYILSYEPGTRLWALRSVGKVKETDSDIIAQMYLYAHQVATQSGYEHYEISNFALPGRRARHNTAYWAGSPYLGLGPGAHSFLGTTRRYNPSNINQWLESIEKGSTAYIDEPESEIDSINDTIMVRLRTAEGLDLNHIPPNVRKSFNDNLARLPEGRIKHENDRIFIPHEQWLISDDTISRLFLLS